MVRFINASGLSNIISISTGKIIAGIMGAVVTPIIAFFDPILTTLSVVGGIMLVDMVFGILRSVKIKGEGLKSKKLWRTVYKFLCATIIISLIYSLDTHVTGFTLYKTVAGIIAGFDLWSILENMAQLTDHSGFRAIKALMSDKVKAVTGISVETVNDEHSKINKKTKKLKTNGSK